MRGIATWLVASPKNAVLGLVVTLLLPIPQMTSGVIMVMLLLAQNKKLVVVESAIGAAVLAVLALILNVSLASMIALIVGTWLPVVFLAMLLLATRSLTLTMQVSVILAIVGMLLFPVVVSDPASFWEPYLTMMAEFVERNNLPLDVGLISADVMTMSAVLAYWILYTAGLMLGYSLYRRLPDETADFGLFRNLNFGRVIAFSLALVSTLAYLIDAQWLQNIAFVLLAMFMMQGLAVAHWVRARYGLPTIALAAVYVLLPVLQIMLVMALAIVGYTDAWFGYRRQLGKA